jgi:hypothetical protein
VFPELEVWPEEEPGVAPPAAEVHPVPYDLAPVVLPQPPVPVLSLDGNVRADMLGFEQLPLAPRREHPPYRVTLNPSASGDVKLYHVHRGPTPSGGDGRAAVAVPASLTEFIDTID